MSFSGSVEAIAAADLVPSTKETRMRRRTVDDVKGGEDRPASVDDHAGAEPCAFFTFRRSTLRLDLDEGRENLLIRGRGARGRRSEIVDRLLDYP